MNTFNAGDEVTLTTIGCRVRVLYGPYQSFVNQDRDTYLVEFLDGTDRGASIEAKAHVLKKGTSFAVGDDVLTLPLETPATVEAGPFKGRIGDTFYVVKFASGWSAWLDAVALKKAGQSRTFTRQGVTWDLDAAYIDTDGDAWTFNGRYEDGVPLMDSPESGGYYRDRTLTSVLSAYGPLIKRD